MSEDSKMTQQRHDEFIKKVCETQKVWALENEDGFATSGSNEYEDEEGEPVEMICFWSSSDSAKLCAIEDWNGYTAVEMTLSNFIENWCTGMSNDGLLIGANFDSEMVGVELDPLELIVEIGEYIKQNKIEIVLEHYKKYSDLVDQVNKALEE